MAGYIGSKTSVSVVSPETDSRYVNVTGDTMTGALGLPSGGLTVGTDQLAVDTSGRLLMPYQPVFSAFNLATASQYPVTAASWDTFNNNLTNFDSPRWSAETNIGSSFSIANGRFTAPVTGRYRITLIVSLWVTNTCYVTLFKNGAYSAPYAIAYNANLAGYQNLPITRVMTLAAGDYVEPGGYLQSGTFVPGGGYIQFSGELIG